MNHNSAPLFSLLLSWYASPVTSSWGVNKETIQLQTQVQQLQEQMTAMPAQLRRAIGRYD